ncbi:MAG: hypothetical protein AAFQ12_14790 [Pseudomonadota bacterium]
MSISELTAKSNHFHARIKRRNITEYIAAALVVGVFGWISFLVPVWSIKIGAVLIMVAALFVSWKLHQIGGASDPGLHSSGQSLASHHREALVRQRNALQSVWRWYLLPFAPGMLVFILGTTFETGAEIPLSAAIASSAISLGFISAIFFGVHALNAHAAKKLDVEINQLDAMMPE